MIDGTYNVSAKTPLGKKSGTLQMSASGDICKAELSIMGKTAHLTGTVADEQVTFSGTIDLPFPLGTQDWELTGSVVGDELSGVCRTKKFSFDVQGTRLS